MLFSQWVFHAAFVATESVNNAPSDTVVLSLEAGVLNWLGINPYGYNMVDVLSAYGSTGQSSTPHLGGSQVEHLPYPPLHFLALRPILPWGLEGARFLYSLSFSLLLVTIYFYAPDRYRPVVLIPVLINPELLNFPFYWSSDSIWALLLALMLVAWKRPLVRGVLLGLACAYKQTPWIFAPFLVVRILREEEKPWKALAVFCGTSIATFAAVNLPYAWNNPKAWFQGTFDPMLSPYVPLGRGWSMLMQTNLMPFAKSYFSVLTLTMFVLSIWFYYLNYQRLRPLLWWFPALILFFSYRSLPHYFIYSVPLLAMELSRHEEEKEPSLNPRHWYLPLVAAGLAFILTTIHYWPVPATVTARIIDLKPNVIVIEVTNNDSKAFQPNFFARIDWRVLPWTIHKGPHTLRPGETARYTIGTDLHYRNVSTHFGSQIVVSDGIGDKGYRAVVDLPVHAELRYPRGFQGPGASPLWGRSGNVWFEGDETHFATEKDADMAVISRQMTLPFGDLAMELKRPEIFPNQASFGMEIRDQMGKTLSILLGDVPGQGFYDSERYYKILASKPGWNSYSLNLRDLYAEAGFALPNLDRMVNSDVELIDRPINLSFVLYCKTPVQGAAVRNVRLLQETVPGHRIADLTSHHREYQAVLGDIAARRREYDKALELYGRSSPLRSAVRTTQEGSFLAVPGPCEFQGAFALAGWGWGEVEVMGPSLARPMTELLGTIPILAKPGLKLQLQFEPPTPYSVRWDGEPWQVVPPDGTFTVPEPAQIRVLSVIPEKAAGLKGISASGP